MRFIKTMSLFIRIFFGKKIETIFYYSVQFDYGDNFYFKQMINYCDRKSENYICLVEPVKGIKYKNRKNTYPFDFFYSLFLAEKKFKNFYTTSNNFNFFSRLIKVFFKKVRPKNVFTIANSGLFYLRYLFEDSYIYECQHGIIHKDHLGYFKKTYIEDLRNLQIDYLLWSEVYKNFFFEYDEFKARRFYSLGKSNHIDKQISQRKNFFFNHKILISLDFSDNDTDERFSKDQTVFLKNFIKENNKVKKFQIYLKPHPRDKKNFEYSEIFNIDKKYIVLQEKFRHNNYCLHLTFYSSLIIDFAARSIPSIILPSFDYTKHNYGLNIGKRVFVDQLGYPIDFDKNILKKINDYSKDIEIYKNDAMAVKRWHSKVQMPFNEKLFEEILKR